MECKIFKYNREEYCYQISIPIIHEKRASLEDYYMARALDIALNEYRKKLIRNFNACLPFGPRGNVYFNTEQDAKQALDWINGILMMNKLCGTEIQINLPMGRI